MSTWEKMVVDAKDFGIKTLTFVEAVADRTLPEIISAIASIVAQLCSLGLPGSGVLLIEQGNLCQRH